MVSFFFLFTESLLTLSPSLPFPSQIISILFFCPSPLAIPVLFSVVEFRHIGRCVRIFPVLLSFYPDLHRVQFPSTPLSPPVVYQTFLTILSTTVYSSQFFNPVVYIQFFTQLNPLVSFDFFTQRNGLASTGTLQVAPYGNAVFLQIISQKIGLSWHLF